MGKTIPETYKDLDPADLDKFVANIQGDVIDTRFRTNQAAMKPNTVKPPKSMGDGKGPVSSGLTKSEERDLKAALDRLHAVNRKPYLGGNERYPIDKAVSNIKQRLEPVPVRALLMEASNICEPLERLLRDIDAHEAVAECLG